MICSTTGRQVEGSSAFGLKLTERLNEGRKGSEGRRTGAVSGRQEGALVNECSAAKRHDPDWKPDVVRHANDQKRADLGK